MKAKKPEKIVSKPFVKGRPLDSRSAFSALRLFGVTLIAAVIFLISSSAFTTGATWIRVTMSSFLMLLYWYLSYSMGIAAGTDAVDFGEKLYRREERGEKIDEKTKRQSYHPIKGGINAFLGMLPFLICAVLLAFVATKQSIGYGTLPSWISSFDASTDVGAPLSYYSVSSPLEMEDVLRVVVRLLLLPVVGIVGSDNATALLQLERMSALILLIMPLVYGIGYMQGPKMRSRVHTDIATNNRKRARKEKKRIQQRKAAAQKDHQLN